MYAKIFKVWIFIHPSSQASPHIYSHCKYISNPYNQALLKKLVFDIPLFWFVPIFVICTRVSFLYLLLIFALALYLLLLFVLAFVICTCFWIFVLAFVIYTYFWYLFFLLICTCFRFLHFSYLLFLYLLLSSRPPQNLLFTSSPSAFDLSLFSDHWPVSIRKEFTAIQKVLS